MKRIVVIVSLFLIAGLGIFSLVKGIKQNEVFKEQVTQVEEINRAIAQQNFSNALLLTQTVQSKLPIPSSLLTQTEGIIQARLMNYDLAAEKMYETLRINPYLIENPTFSLQFLNILMAAEDFVRAKQYVIHCQTYYNASFSSEELAQLKEIEQVLLKEGLIS